MSKGFATVGALILAGLAILAIPFIPSKRYFGAPMYQVYRSLVPETDSLYYIGTTSKAWQGTNINNLTVNNTSALSDLQVSGALETVCGNQINFSADGTFTNNYISLGCGTEGQLSIDNDNYSSVIDTNTLTSSRTYTLPDWTGEFVVSTSTTQISSLNATSTTATSTVRGGLLIFPNTATTTRPMMGVQIGSNVVSAYPTGYEDGTIDTLAHLSVGYTAAAANNYGMQILLSDSAYRPVRVGIGIPPDLAYYGNQVNIGGTVAAEGYSWSAQSAANFNYDAANLRFRMYSYLRDLYFSSYNGSAVIDNLIIKPATGYVGIGTTSPWRTLSVHGNSDLGMNALAGYFTATTTTASVFPYASTTALSATTLCLTTDCRTSWPTGTGGGGVGWASTTADTQSIYFYGTGDVAIGTTSSQSRLHVTDLTGGGITIDRATIADNETSVIDFKYGDGLYKTGEIKAVKKAGGGGDLIFAPANSATTYSDLLYLTKSGFVGIGTSSPATKLMVNGGITGGPQVTNVSNYSIGSDVNESYIFSPTQQTNATVGTETALNLNRSGTFGNKYNSSASFDIGTYATGLNAQSQLDLRLGNGGVHVPDMTAMTWRGDGNVGIGSTSPYAKLSVVGQTVSAYFTATTTTASTFPYASTTMITATTASTTDLTVSSLTSALLLTNTTGGVGEYAGTSCTNQFVRSLSAVGAATCATVANTDLANSTISGVALGSNLNALTNDATLNGSSYNGSSAISDWGINLANSNSWTALQQFANASSTFLSSNFTDVFSRLRIPTSTDPTINIAGSMAVNTTQASTSIRYHDGTNEMILSPFRYVMVSYATSTAWTGTTTLQLGPAFDGQTFIASKCFTDAGTLNASVYDGTNRMDMISISSTVAETTLSTNNTFVLSEKRFIDIGTPASSPTRVSCSIKFKLTPEP